MNNFEVINWRLYTFQAAQFGKTFANNMDSENYVRMCRTLRILNAVRHPKVGIFLTYPQYPFNENTTI